MLVTTLWLIYEFNIVVKYIPYNDADTVGAWENVSTLFFGLQTFNSQNSLSVKFSFIRRNPILFVFLHYYAYS